MEKRTSMKTAMSTDVVMGIVLSHLKVRDLLNCRKVSKFWNKAASSVLRKRSTMIKKISSKAKLKELGECMRQNSDFPFAGLKIHGPWVNSPCVKQFFKNYGDKFTSLYFGPSWDTKTRIQDLALFVNNLPRLSVLELQYKNNCHPRELLDCAAGPKDGTILNFPSLRTLRIFGCEMSQDFLRQIFTTASASLRIECLDTGHQILEALGSAGKLQAVSVLDVNLPEEQDEEVRAAVRLNQLFTTQTPALTKLDVMADGCISQEGLMKLLISSQKTLKYLGLVGICPSQFSSECPVLVKLTTLYLCNWSRQSYEYVFQGRQGHKFPALQELEIDNRGETYEPWYHDMSDGLFIVPSVKSIDLNGYVSKTGIEDLARSFPNVIQIQLNHNLYESRDVDDREPNDIWSVGAFKFLEKLTIRDCNVKQSTKNHDNSDYQNDFKKFKITNMDRFLTGIPITICENLRKHNQQSLAVSPFHEILRDSPNVVQLKHLKELIVSVDLDFDDKWDELPEELPFISMVSVWYALQMIPNLKARFVYDYSSLSFRFDKETRDQAVKVLKAAFKHVQPHVELEQLDVIDYS